MDPRLAGRVISPGRSARLVEYETSSKGFRRRCYLPPFCSQLIRSLHFLLSDSLGCNEGEFNPALLHSCYRVYLQGTWLPTTNFPNFSAPGDPSSDPSPLLFDGPHRCYKAENVIMTTKHPCTQPNSKTSDIWDDKQFFVDHPGAVPVTTAQGEELKKLIGATYYIQRSSQTHEVPGDITEALEPIKKK